MTQPFPDLPVVISPSRGLLTVRLPTQPDRKAAERFVSALRAGQLTDVVLYEFEAAARDGSHMGANVPLREVTFVSEAPFVDYGALDDVDTTTWELKPAREEDRWMAELAHAYVDVVIAVAAEDWSAVEALRSQGVNLHLAVTVRAA